MELFTLDNLFTLGMLIILQAVLGFDNLLYISLESKRAPADQQAKVRKLGIGIAVALRIVLLFALIKLISYVDKELFTLSFEGIVEGHFDLKSVIFLFGGVFIIYTAMKEIMHMMHIEEDMQLAERKSTKSAAEVIFLIVLMNLVFSFDSILTAMGLSDVFLVMATAIIIGGILMIWLADKVASFLEKNRMYEVLGLFILFVVGIMLLSEGGHLAHLTLFGSEIQAMSKSTFYFVIAAMVLCDIVQTRYQKKLLKKRKQNLESVS